MRAGLLVLLIAVMAAGCAPLNASTAIREAENQIEKAEESGAHRDAPYEYWLARSYLRKAKTTEGYSEFGVAEQYGVRAKEFALQAMSEARENRMRRKILQERTDKGAKRGGK